MEGGVEGLNNCTSQETRSHHSQEQSSVIHNGSIDEACLTNRSWAIPNSLSHGKQDASSKSVNRTVRYTVAPLENQTTTTSMVKLTTSSHVENEQLNSVGTLLGIPNPNLSQNVMISIIEDPIQCGYLLVFCQSEHSTENLRFTMEVIRYREKLANDKNSWTKTWQVIDLERSKMETDVPYNWPSEKFEQKYVEELVQGIWDNFLADNSATQICMPADVVTNTKARMSRLDLYGPEVFGEALLDPIKTLQRDILPRFLNSPLCADMVERIDSLRHLPSAFSLHCPPPPESTLLCDHPLEYFVDGRQFALESILHDRILFGLFSEYLRKSVQIENLLCARMIEIFEELFDMETQDLTAIVNLGWNIYRYFIAPGAAYEVSLYALHKKEVMINLANPHRKTFEELNKSAMSMLTVSYNAYKFTEDYRKLSKIMREEKKKAMANSANGMAVGNLLGGLFRRTAT